MSAFAVLEPGPLTTVQDLGRAGYLRYGILPSGPVDQSAFILANRLVGATVCSVDIGAVGHVKPGQRLRFRSVSVAEAHFAVGAERDRLAKGVISQ